MKGSEKLIKYLVFARELKNLWKMKLTMIPIMVRALRTIPKNLEKRLKKLEIRGITETTFVTSGLKLIKIMRRVLETLGNFLPLRLQ